MTPPEPNALPPSSDAGRGVLDSIFQKFPDAKFLALGQSVFWDEPVKAGLLRILQQNGYKAELWAGVHDTDYFAKAQTSAKRGSFALMPHNGGSTRNLWSAAGEISALFGSETFPTRHDLVKAGVSFERSVRASGKTRQEFLDEITEAWGWRGLVYSGSSDLIVSQLELSRVGPGILDTLRWAFTETVHQIAAGCCQEEASRIADLLIGKCSDFINGNPDKSLSDLFQHLLPEFYELLLGSRPDGLNVTATSKLLKLTPETASLPRFKFVDLFLNPKTRHLATTAYNHAVEEEEMYGLEQFGEGALPFDIITPDRGRGTLRLTPRALFIETKQPIALALDQPIESIQQLADRLAKRFPDGVTITGKAVSLISMLAQEFVFVFNEEGSMYVRRTRQMNDELRAAGIDLDMRPILRMKYSTWNAIGKAHSSLKLAPHFASIAGTDVLTAEQFAACWRNMIEASRDYLERLHTVRTPKDSFDFLAAYSQSNEWDVIEEGYIAASDGLKRLRTVGAEIQNEVNRLYSELKSAKAEMQSAQTAMGTASRSDGDRQVHADRFESALNLKNTLLKRIATLKAERFSLERGSEATEYRNIRETILNRLELAKIQGVRDAILVKDGLPHTAHRPSFWWFPMIDASGAWYQRLVETTELYLQPM